MSVYLDTNIVIRHLTGDPPAQARQATRYLAAAPELVLPDLIVAEIVYVLESFYEVPRPQVADLVRAVLAFPPITVGDERILLRAIEVYEVNRLDFAEAYLVACAEADAGSAIASFDRAVGRVGTVGHIDPSRAR